MSPPVDLVFHPDWWHTHYDLSFDEPFHFDPKVRVESERRMRQALYDRFGDLGLGEADARPRPVVGPVHLAIGFVVQAMLGCQVRFAPNASPQVVCANLTDEQVMALEAPEIECASLMRETIVMMDALEAEYGYLEGDIPWDGVLNVALDLRGQQLFLDFYDDPALVHHLFDVVARTTCEVACYVRQRTGTTSISLNRIVASLDPRLNLHSNCAVKMISNEMYEEFLLPYDIWLAERLKPYGVHHCGDNLHRITGYAKIKGADFFDVGWGSDVAACREMLPCAFFSLRLSPVRLREQTPQEVAADVENLLAQAGPLEQTVVCCVGIDSTVPDDNIRAIFETVKRYRI
jgi:uroporphyrinogen-III decarboxylase